jgi:protein phosphatase 2C family protein 2/3
VLACDGIWDVLTNEQVVAFCRKRLGEGCAPEQVIMQMFNALIQTTV